jgi:photosystem II stability/assembly factor-like uncharacterized protein
MNRTATFRMSGAAAMVVCATLCGCNGKNEQAPPAQGAPPQPATAPTPQPPSSQPPVGVDAGWLRRLPNKAATDLTFADFKGAFDGEYGANALALEDIRPYRLTLAANAETPAQKKAAEERKLFRRWEWFTAPRVYPSGRWDSERVFTELQRVRSVDGDLLGRVGAPLGAAPPKWLPIGPFDAVGGTNLGRVNAIAFDPVDPKVIYIGAADGGLWRSPDSGSTWVPLTDTLPTLSIADIAIDPVNPKHIFIATGDGFGYGNPFWGGTYSIGVWVTTDGGGTWNPTGLTLAVALNRTVRRLAMHPKNPQILLAATSAGLFRTADGGVTWTSIWNTSTFDVEFNPSDGSVVYATTAQLLKSTNAGVSFAALSVSCPGARYNVEVARSSPNTVYTLCTNGTVQKSINAGGSWSTTTAPGVTLYGYYDNVLAVSPIDPNLVVVAGFDIRRTTNGGTSWAALSPAGHVDNHCLRFAPGSSTTLLGGNDGGIFRTVNGGTTWSSLSKGLAITQFYRLGLSRITAGLMTAGAQDNGNMKLSAGAWANITNADGMGGFIDFANDNNVYATIQNGALYRSMNGGSTWTGINTPATGAWVTPFLQDPVVAKTIYAATDKVYKSTTQGTSWSAISGALTGISQFTILKVNANPKVILAGDGHKLFRTTNAGASWADITGSLPVAANYLTDAAMSDSNPQLIWTTFSGYNPGQKVFKSLDGGASWTNISGALPNIPMNCVVSEKKALNPIYIGTDSGVYYVKDGLAGFVPFKFGLPNVIVDELEIHYGSLKLVAATYGRGLWRTDLKP